MPTPNLATTLSQLQTSARAARETADTLYERARDVEKRVTDAVENTAASTLSNDHVDNLTTQVTGIQRQIDDLVQAENNLAETLQGIASALGQALAIVGL